jgi:ubiquinone/menaquinone biosynthesis C-methylase UbiE
MGDTIDYIRNWRRYLVEDLGGEVLEIGVGSGTNLKYYRNAHHVWAIEPDVERVAAARAVSLNAPVPVDVREAAAEALPFEDDTFDHVVSSLVFCSVTEPKQALAEIERVLRPGGTLHMLEHVRPKAAPLGWLAGAVTPTWSKAAGNCHLDRMTVELLKQQGWGVKVYRRVGIFVRMDAMKP